MGSQHSKQGTGYRSKRSSVAEESLANSLDLIYIDDYFDDARYLKLVAKRLAEKEKAENKLGRKKATFSDTVISTKNTSSRSTRSRTRMTQSFTSRTIPTVSPSSNTSYKNVKGTSTSRPTTTTSASKFTSKPSTISSSKYTSSKQSKTHVFPSLSASKKTIPSTSTSDKLSTSQTTSNKPISSSLLEEKERGVQTSPWHKSTSADTTLERSSSRVQVSEPSKKPRSVLTTSKPPDKLADSLRKQRSYTVLSSTTYAGHPQKSHSVATDSFPASSNAQTRPQTRPPSSQQTHPKSQISANLQTSKPVSANNSRPKKKLVVRGLRNYVSTHKRDSSGFPSTNSKPNLSYGCKGCPDLWKREFPSKSKFHPDNFIYDWAEGPKAPPRPFSAMAKCKKHGGRCNDCGLFTCDLCQSCRKCETDCACPCPNRGNTCSNPYSPTGVYHEIFGDENWNKARNVICNLTEQDKMHPVGGNANKKKLDVEDNDTNWAKDNFYKSQIDVLNPYNVPLRDVPQRALVQQPLLQHPMFVPPMFPMQFMPMMAMPPPMMPYYPPMPPPPCLPYNPGFVPPPYPYPPSDSFVPVQNY